MKRMEGTPSHIAEMQRQMRYEKKRPKYYAHLAEKYAMTSDNDLIHERNVNWIVGWLLFGAILLFVIVGCAYGFSHGEYELIGLVFLGAVCLCVLVDVLLMEPADEIRRRSLVKWQMMVSDKSKRS